MQISRQAFARLRTLILELCGIAVAEDKEYLVQNRLEPVLKERGYSSFEQLCQRLADRSDITLSDAVVDAVTTHETSFFRDAHVFEALAGDVLPNLISRAVERTGTARIWSAGASTGQEAYSLAILAMESPGLAPLRRHRAFPTPLSILATDISGRALAIARRGEYAHRDVINQVSMSRRQQFFQELPTGFRVSEDVRPVVEFRKLNLTAPLGAIGPFDLISCRNVLIYFDLPTRQRFFAACEQVLADGGYLLLGAAENLYGTGAAFESIPLGERGLIYRRV